MGCRRGRSGFMKSPTPVTACTCRSQFLLAGSFVHSSRAPQDRRMRVAVRLAAGSAATLQACKGLARCVRPQITRRIAAQAAPSMSAAQVGGSAPPLAAAPGLPTHQPTTCSSRCPASGCVQPLPGPAEVNSFIDEMNAAYEKVHVEYEKWVGTQQAPGGGSGRCTFSLQCWPC